MVPWIETHDPLPRTSQALGPDSDAPGLLAAGSDLSNTRLEQAYRSGIFPWFGVDQPVLWWSPSPRMVLPVQAFKVSRSLRKTLRRFIATPGCEVRIDTAFEQVIQACSTTPREGQSGTWIVPAMVQAYTAWHRAGHVHSVETWIDGELAGGLYCVGIGRMVFGESMFAHRTDASKIALAALVAWCRSRGVGLIDCQQNTRHLASLGAHEITREAFEQHLAQTTPLPDLQDWSYHRSAWAQLPALDEEPPCPVPPALT
ncbi:MAG: leucyl/phenylalanyl-tRNA--protein transferase [Betaproteobacteria bacterium]|jgi:leucyl/phenylalanyl-tRNA--protein transferase